MPAKPKPTPKFFATPADWRAWLEQHHAHEQELWVGFYKRDSGRPSITWPQSVDGALCFGWIDGVRRSLGEISYMIRFTPRKPRSVWSSINVQRITELSASGRVHPTGLAAFQKRSLSRSGIYAYEQRNKAKLPAALEKEFRADRAAWKFFQSQPPWYRRTSTYWVISAKKDETRRKRFAKLLADSASQRTLPQLTRSPKK